MLTYRYRHELKENLSFFFLFFKHICQQIQQKSTFFPDDFREDVVDI